VDILVEDIMQRDEGKQRDRTSKGWVRRAGRGSVKRVGRANRKMARSFHYVLWTKFYVD
jgi:hypothetical protein